MGSLEVGALRRGNCAMPTYVYEVINEDGTGGEWFEVVQSMSEKPITKHPETGEPVRRVIQAPMIGGKFSEASTKKSLSNENLDRLGFTKYEKVGKGQYEKKAGQGPSIMNAD